MNRVFESRTDDAGYLSDDRLPETLNPFFDHMRETYHQFLRVSGEALAANEKWCEVDLGQGPVKMRSLKYSEVSDAILKMKLNRWAQKTEPRSIRCSGHWVS